LFNRNWSEPTNAGPFEGYDMLDIILLAVGVLSFALFFIYGSACDRL
jgi:hypothetical protein